VDGQDGGLVVGQHAIGRVMVGEARSRCVDGSFLHDAERFGRRVCLGKIPTAGTMATR